ncbi:MAG: hypothetical protein AAB336_09345 [Acidobacteriota bacterium]
MKLKLFLLFILLAGFCLNSFAQVAEFSQSKVTEISEAESFARWDFEISSTRYEVLSSGRAKKISAKNTVTKFNLPLGKNETVYSNVFFAQHKTDLILLYEANMGGEGLGYIAAFDSSSMNLKWKAVINGFNVGKGLLENQFAYLTAIGFVAKINLLTGKYVWKHDNLYRRFNENGAFNIFETPELEKSNVIFTEKTHDNIVNIIVANKTSGRIIRTILDGK